jgi:hypothetical protein
MVSLNSNSPGTVDATQKQTEHPILPPDANWHNVKSQGSSPGQSQESLEDIVAMIIQSVMGKLG